MRTLARAVACGAVALCSVALSSARAAAQASIAGTVYDSLSSRAPLANATILLVERSRYTSTDAHGRFQFDSVPAGRYSLGVLHVVLDSFDLTLPAIPVDVSSGSRTDVELAIPSAATAYAKGCRQRSAEVATKTDLVAVLRAQRACRDLARRADTLAASAGRTNASNSGDARAAQRMATVAVLDTVHSMSLMAIDGFYERRKHGLGTFLTDSQLKKLPTQKLSEMLASVAGMHVEYGTNNQPMLYMTGIGVSGMPYCIPTYFVDGTPFDLTPGAGSGVLASSGGGGGGHSSSGGLLAGGRGGGGPALSSPFNDLALMIRPEMIMGLEVYETGGVIPAQYDRTSSTGCGSVVIWTR